MFSTRISTLNSYNQNKKQMGRQIKLRKAQNKGEAIVGDGLCEKLYFDQMKYEEGLTSRIEPQLPKTGSWSRVFDTVDNLLRNEEYNHIYCLIDFDKVIEESAAYSRYLSRKNKFEKTGKVTVFECNPCFETWYLVHFEKTGKLFDNCNHVADTLRKHINDYAKDEKYYTRKAIYKHLKPFQKTAIKNAEFLELNRKDYSEHYPRAEVFKLIEQLIPPQ
jgi:RloB-like protein